jgi:hypothetical protein
LGRHHLLGPDGELVIGAESAFGLGGRHAFKRELPFPETEPDTESNDPPTVRFYGPEWNELIETAVLDPIPSTQDLRHQASDMALNRDPGDRPEVPLDPTDPAALQRVLDGLRRWNPHTPRRRKD